MSADEPVMELDEAVAKYGALPMPMSVPVVPEPLSAERLAEIRDRAGIATEGPWRVIEGHEIHQGAEFGDFAVYVAQTDPDCGCVQSVADAEFIAHAREDVPALVAEVRRQAARIAELEAERHSTNEALTEITVALREKEAAPLTVFRASHESIVMGLYDNRQAAMDHVHATLGNEEGGDVTARVIWRADDPEADEPTWECWLFDADMADDSPTGYVVEPLEVASAHDLDADE